LGPIEVQAGPGFERFEGDSNGLQASRTWTAVNGFALYHAGGGLPGDAGIAGADAACSGSDDTYNPGRGRTWKALLVDGVNRRACVTADCVGGAAEGIDWVFRPNTQYHAPAQLGVHVQTNAAAIVPVASLPAVPLSPRSSNPWTGLAVDWTVLREGGVDFDCNNWSSQVGEGGVGWTGVGVFHSGGRVLCSEARSLICVEQPR
jgi:hypothetical protein